MRLIPLLASALVLGLTGSPHVGARPAPTISVVPSDVSLSVGETQQLVATVRAASGVAVSRAAVVWSSSNPALAAVSGSGVVTAVAPGRAGITAASGGEWGLATVTVLGARPATLASPVQAAPRPTPPVASPVASPVSPVASTGRAPAPSGASSARPALCANEPAGYIAQTNRDMSTAYLASTPNRQPGWLVPDEEYYYKRGSFTIVPAPDDPLSPGAMQLAYPVGLAGGTGPAGAYFAPPTRTRFTYICMSVRYSANFEGNGITKLGYVNWPGGSFILLAAGAGTTAPLGFGMYINHGAFYLSNGAIKPHTGNISSSLRFTRGRWGVLEMLFEMSSGPGIADGRIRAWLDGAPGMNATGYAFPAASTAGLAMAELRLHAIWGGGAGPRGCCVTVPGTFEIGHVYVSGK